MEITQSSIPNQAIIFWRHTDSRLSLMLNYISGKGREQNCLANSNFWCKYMYFSFFPPSAWVNVLFSAPFFSSFLQFARLRWWILCCSSSKAQGEAPEIRANGGEGGVEREGTVREKCYVGQWRIALGYCLLSSQSGKLIWFPVNPSDLNYERLPSLKSPWWLP